jgi:hypothetical protein
MQALNSLPSATTRSQSPQSQGTQSKIIAPPAQKKSYRHRFLDALMAALAVSAV